MCMAVVGLRAYSCLSTFEPWSGIATALQLGYHDLPSLYFMINLDLVIISWLHIFAKEMYPFYEILNICLQICRWRTWRKNLCTKMSSTMWVDRYLRNDKDDRRPGRRRREISQTEVETYNHILPLLTVAWGKIREEPEEVIL